MTKSINFNKIAGTATRRSKTKRTHRPHKAHSGNLRYQYLEVMRNIASHVFWRLPLQECREITHNGTLVRRS